MTINRSCIWPIRKRFTLSVKFANTQYFELLNNSLLFRLSAECGDIGQTVNFWHVIRPMHFCQWKQYKVLVQRFLTVKQNKWNEISFNYREKSKKDTLSCVITEKDTLFCDRPILVPYIFHLFNFSTPLVKICGAFNFTDKNQKKVH